MEFLHSCAGTLAAQSRFGFFKYSNMAQSHASRSLAGDFNKFSACTTNSLSNRIESEGSPLGARFACCEALEPRRWLRKLCQSSGENVYNSDIKQQSQLKNEASRSNQAALVHCQRAIEEQAKQILNGLPAVTLQVRGREAVHQDQPFRLANQIRTEQQGKHCAHIHHLRNCWGPAKPSRSHYGALSSKTDMCTHAATHAIVAKSHSLVEYPHQGTPALRPALGLTSCNIVR
jgi:hypothetical protein